MGTRFYSAFKCRMTSQQRRHAKKEINGLLLAYKKTKCPNLLLLTDHVYEDVERDGLSIQIRPVYEWCTESFVV